MTKPEHSLDPTQRRQLNATWDTALAWKLAEAVNEADTEGNHDAATSFVLARRYADLRAADRRTGQEGMSPPSSGYRMITAAGNVLRVNRRRGTEFDNCLLYTSPSPRDRQ